MNLNHLSYMIAIASNGTLSAAARQLHISQPALSKYLNALEAQVGMELFFRNQKQYLPTPAGRLYLQSAQQMLELYRHAKSSAELVSSSDRSVLRIGVTPNEGIGELAEIYPSFDKQFPLVHMEIREEHGRELVLLLQQGELDGIFVTMESSTDKSLSVLPLFREELVLAVPAFHPSVSHSTAVFDELPFADLHDYENSVFILPDPGIRLNAIVHEIFRRADFHPQIVTSCSNILIPAAMIRSGTRVGILPAHFMTQSRDIAFFRLLHSPLLTASYITPASRSYTAAERYLIYLYIKSSIRSARKLAWSAELRSILWEFDPMEAAAQGLEEPYGYKNS